MDTRPSAQRTSPRNYQSPIQILHDIRASHERSLATGDDRQARRRAVALAVRPATCPRLPISNADFLLAARPSQRRSLIAHRGRTVAIACKDRRLDYQRRAIVSRTRCSPIQCVLVTAAATPANVARRWQVRSARVAPGRGAATEQACPIVVSPRLVTYFGV